MHSFVTRIQKYTDGFLPPFVHGDTDATRRSRLIIGAGFLGGTLGLGFALFYLAIGHYYGSTIVATCDIIFLAVPWFLHRSKGGLKFYGHLICTVLILGFSALTSIEGGVSGHAVAWLSTVPLCAVLLIGVEASYWWCMASVGATLVFSFADLWKPGLMILYPAEWHWWINTAGYVSLSCFLFLLALIFERSRAQALAKTVEANARLSKANTDLAQANKRLLTLDAEKNEFIGIAAHDLKNPLMAVLGYAEILAMQTNPTREYNYLYGEHIKTAAERMLHLIKNLLDINAMEHGLLAVNIREVDLGSLIKQTIALQQITADRKKITIHFDPRETVYVMADSAATLQIVENFISNAVKYSPKSSNIYINITERQGRVTMEVRDEGPGLSAEDQTMLFQKFSRLTPQPTDGESSNGLGLSIVKRLAEAMGGEVGCQSQLGLGTTFSVSLRGHRAAVAA
ncbi:MAG: HAMP domain-containing sensor histidine kinase [Chthoniobacteraceae bacterium]